MNQCEFEMIATAEITYRRQELYPALARSLQPAGDPAEPANVVRLRRPALAAWTGEQLVRLTGRRWAA
jgi:hypothetical protein